MLMRNAIIASLALAASAPPAPAQDDSLLIGMLQQPPPPAAEPLHIDTRTMTLAEAALTAEQLTDDILVLSRIVTLQEALLETNATRIASGAPPLLLPHQICSGSPLATMCGILPLTFAPASGDQP